jgi:hypothetical protein
MSQAAHEQAAAQHEQQASWTSVTSPTPANQSDAERHRKMAADHRAAAQSLRDAETRSCAGISELDRDMGPFEHREDIVSVTPFVVTTPQSKQQVPVTRGAVVTFRAVQGMTVEWLQRLVDCHLARSASVGFNMPEMPDCPMAVKGARASVASTGSGFAVTVESDDSNAAQQILRRAQGLAGK